MMSRFTHFFIAVILLPLLICPMILLALLIRFGSKGPVIYWSKRIGKDNKIFEMPKFRSMKIDTPQVATHLLDNDPNYFIPFGRFIRQTSLDEIPQIFSIIKGDMVFVGPRPALFNQVDLIELRKSFGVDKLTPGITGLAQIKGRDNLSIIDKVNLDAEYLAKKSIFLDLKIMLLTVKKVLKRDGVSH
jgi:O-antigen biosynthesis protein WbqP